MWSCAGVAARAEGGLAGCHALVAVGMRPRDVVRAVKRPTSNHHHRCRTRCSARNPKVHCSNPKVHCSNPKVALNVSEPNGGYMNECHSKFSPRSQWPSYTRLRSIVQPYAPARVWRQGRGNLKQLVIEWCQHHLAYAQVSKPSASFILPRRICDHVGRTHVLIRL